MVENGGATSDKYIDRMRAARRGPSVLKHDLVSLRSSVPTAPIFAFEGKDDKSIYFHWTKRVRDDVEYYPFPCNGKEQVLQLKDVVERDMGNLATGVYFFIDRDFDNTRGREHTENLFMTDAYSVENYLVSEVVLTELLKNEFSCDFSLSYASDIRGLFVRLYSDYLEFTSDLNFRLFAIRRSGIRLISTLPDKINKIARVSLDTIEKSAFEIAELISAEREPTEDELEAVRLEFDVLIKPLRYRGKFALLFFMKWLEELALDRNCETPKFFDKSTKNKVHFQRITIDALASKSEIPPQFRDFINRIEGVK